MSIPCKSVEHSVVRGQKLIFLFDPFLLSGLTHVVPCQIPDVVFFVLNSSMHDIIYVQYIQYCEHPACWGNGGANPPRKPVPVVTNHRMTAVQLGARPPSIFPRRINFPSDKTAQLSAYSGNFCRPEFEVVYSKVMTPSNYPNRSIVAAVLILQRGTQSFQLTQLLSCEV